MGLRLLGFIYRWLLRTVLLGGLLLLLFIATFGFWLDRAIRWQGPHIGLTVEEVRGGWGWVDLQGIRWTLPEGDVLELDSLRFSTPLAVFHAWITAGSTPPLHGGVLKISLAEREQQNEDTFDLAGTMQEVAEWLNHLAVWEVEVKLDELQLAGAIPGHTLVLQHLQLADSHLSAEWPGSREISQWLPKRLNLSASLSTSFLNLHLVDELGARSQLIFSWQENDITFALAIERAAANLRANGRATGDEILVIEQLRLHHPAFEAELLAPWTVFEAGNPGFTGAVEFSLTAELSELIQGDYAGRVVGTLGWETSPWSPWPALYGSLASNELLIDAVVIESAGIRFRSAEGHSIEGRMAAAAVQLPTPNGDWGDAVSRLLFPSFAFRVHPQGIKISAGAVEFNEGRLLFEGGLPVSPMHWAGQLGDDWLRWWQASNWRIFLDEFELAAVPDLLPAILRPTGSFMGKVSKQSGEIFPHGNLLAKDLSLRPLPNFGSIQGIGFTLTMEGPRLRIEKGGGILGRRPVLVSGEMGLAADLTPTDFRLQIEGSRIRLVRQPRFLLHGDVDLLIEGHGREPGRVSGIIRPTRGMLFQNLPSLRPSPADSRRRPPYFSVTEEPWRSWELSVAVRGEEFLEIRNPFARLLLSADFRLGGTLEEPRAIGSITVDRSLISFPFVRFRSQDGRIESVPANPFDPEIAFQATGRLYGYDLSLEVSGSVSDPIVTFSSSPFLESTEILQMISTGVLPAAAGDERQARFSTLGLYFGLTLLDGVRTDHLRFSDEPSVLERTEIEFGREITQSGLDTINVEMPISNRFSVLGEYDRFDTYNLNLRWRIFTR